MSASELIKKSLNKTQKAKRLKYDLPAIYAKEARKPIKEDKVVFMEKSQKQVSNSFFWLYNYLTKYYDLDIVVHFLGQGDVKGAEGVKRQGEFIKDAATAKYIIFNDSADVMGVLQHKRKGQRIMNTWHGCGAFKRFGFGTADKIFGQSAMEMRAFPLHADYDLVTVSSPEITWAYVEAFGIPEKKADCVKPLGISRTDVFFDDRWLSASKERFYEIVPHARGKKVILYAPTFRGRVAQAHIPPMLSIEDFHKEFSDEYVLIFKYHPHANNRPDIPNEYQDFAYDLTDEPIEMLMNAADICISDYSSLIFEYAIFERPMIFFSYDLENYFDWRGFYYPYDELAPGPVCYTNREMIDYIKNIDERFDIERIRGFKDKFMSSCDGHATERIIDDFFTGIEEYRRSRPLDDADYHLLVRYERYGEYQRELDGRLSLKKKAKRIFDEAAKNGTYENTAVILCDKDTTKGDLAILQRTLEKSGTDASIFDEVSSENVEELAKKLANAKTVYAAGQPDILRMISPAKDSRVIEIPTEIIPLYPAYQNETDYIAGIYHTECKQLPYYEDFDGICIPSDRLSALYHRNYVTNDDAADIDCGNPIIDGLFLEKRKDNIRGLIKEHINSMGDKKVIYILMKDRPQLAKYVEELMLSLHEHVVRDYVCLLDIDTKSKSPAYELPDYFKGFVVSAKDAKVSRFGGICAADAVITDYCGQAFAAYAKKTPLLVWMPDKKEFYKDKEEYVDIASIVPSAVCESSRDVAARIANGIGDENISGNEYLLHCDGRSSKRLADKESEF